MITCLKPELIAEALTELTEQFLDAINLKDITAWLLDNNNGKSIQNIAQLSKNITNWLAYQIISESAEKIQQNLVRKVIKIGCEFHRLQNYWGIAQVVSVLNRSDLQRLKCLKHKKKFNLEINKLAELVNPDNNYCIYRALILELHKQNSVIPNVDVIFMDPKSIFEMRDEKIIEDAWLQQMASMFKNILSYKKQAKIVNTKNKLFTAFFSNVPFIPDEVIEAYSHIQIPWRTFKERPSRWKTKKLELWNCHDLYIFLESKDLLPCFHILLEAGLWDGALINTHIYDKYLSNLERTNTLIENGIAVDLVSKLEMNLFLSR